MPLPQEASTYDAPACSHCGVKAVVHDVAMTPWCCACGKQHKPALNVLRFPSLAPASMYGSDGPCHVCKGVGCPACEPVNREC